MGSYLAKLHLICSTTYNNEEDGVLTFLSSYFSVVKEFFFENEKRVKESNQAARTLENSEEPDNQEYWVEFGPAVLALSTKILNDKKLLEVSEFLLFF